MSPRWTHRSVHVTARPGDTCLIRAASDLLRQATLADSALYVRYLRKRLLELELLAARQQQVQQPPGEAAPTIARLFVPLSAGCALKADCGDGNRPRSARPVVHRYDNRCRVAFRAIDESVTAPGC
jgi:hypothetical protein